MPDSWMVYNDDNDSEFDDANDPVGEPDEYL